MQGYVCFNHMIHIPLIYAISHLLFRSWSRYGLPKNTCFIIILFFLYIFSLDVQLPCVLCALFCEIFLFAGFFLKVECI